jgi:type IV secretory pathway TrbL component
MGNQFSVDVAQVQQHAGTVSGLAGQVQQAAGTANAAVSGDAYGVIGQFFASAILQACGDIQGGITTAAQTMQSVSNGLKASGELYQRLDELSAAGFSGTTEGA